MENPVEEIPGVIRALTQSSPQVQYDTLQRYFVPDAAFAHPFCRVEHGSNSRWWIGMIYRWYKIMSPRIDLNVQSVAFDEPNRLLYVKLHQVFKIWAIPFHYAPVDLVTVLELVKYTPPASEAHSYAAIAAPSSDKPELAKEKYFIKSQNDLYQVNEFVKFVDIFRIVWAVLFLWQWAATMFCAVGAYVFWPVTWAEQNAAGKVGSRGNETAGELLNGVAGEALATGNELIGKIGHNADQKRKAIGEGSSSKGDDADSMFG